ncbi:hypothetical protein RZN22_10330 [Bacillaceae bacterium S4-13-58]
MKKIFVGTLIAFLLLGLFLVVNHREVPTREDVYKITENWTPSTEYVYLVKKIDGEWFTIFKNVQSIMVSRLEQNWLGFWEFKDKLGGEAPITSVYYPPGDDDAFTWVASGLGEDRPTYFFGQVVDGAIQDIKIETQTNSFESAPIINVQSARFFFLKSEDPVVMPVNIRAYSKSGKLIYTTLPESLKTE